ncbi:metal-dependent transcriptional regulator [soil metagenome]
MEAYLKAIYELGESSVKTQEVARALSVSAASVTGMLKKLGDLKLVDYAPYRGVSLTPAGRLVALETLRHHRLIETYLAQALGYAWHEVHAEADKLEHVISEDFEERIAALLGDPAFDPHGDPIPSRDGVVPETKGQPLATLETGTRATLTRTTNQDPEVLRYLAEHGLMPGRTVTVLQRAPFDGPLTLGLVSSDTSPPKTPADAATLAIAHTLAQHLHAEVLR